jgi:hypothetical protein
MTTSLLEAIQQVEEALTCLADALVRGSAEDVLQAEGPLGAAVTQVTRVRDSGIGVDDAPAVRRAMSGVRAAVVRCETLGRSAEQYRRAVFPDAEYGRRGLPHASAARPRHVRSLS